MDTRRGAPTWAVRPASVRRMPRSLISDHAHQATSLEAEARDLAGSGKGFHTGALLIEAANQWRLAGDTQHCRDLLSEIIDGGGDMACYARAELAGLMLDDGAIDAARAELSALAEDPDLTDLSCQLVAELLTDHGVLDAALEWYDRAVARWDDTRRATAGRAEGRISADRMTLQQRRRVRKRLGLAPDPTDQLI